MVTLLDKVNMSFFAVLWLFLCFILEKQSEINIFILSTSLHAP